MRISGTARCAAVAALAFATTAVVATPAVATPARGGASIAKAKRKASKPSKKASGESNVEASIVIKLTPPEESLPITNKINLFVPERFRDAGASLPHCEVATMQSKGTEGCPKGSIIGIGKAIGYTILGGQFVIEHLTVTIVNGPKAELLTWVEGRTPVAIEEVVEGVISKPGGFGEEMAFTIPHGLLEPVPGAPGWLQTLEAHISAKSGWLRSTSCPPHPWKLKAELGYESGQATIIEAKLQCAASG